eukprot:scaffold553_cov238-Pinguiococcus_pyrenoidosus.AAC.7
MFLRMWSCASRPYRIYTWTIRRISGGSRRSSLPKPRRKLRTRWGKATFGSVPVVEKPPLLRSRVGRRRREQPPQRDAGRVWRAQGRVRRCGVCRRQSRPVVRWQGGRAAGRAGLVRQIRPRGGPLRRAGGGRAAAAVVSSRRLLPRRTLAVMVTLCCAARFLFRALVTRSSDLQVSRRLGSRAGLAQRSDGAALRECAVLRAEMVGLQILPLADKPCEEGGSRPPRLRTGPRGSVWRADHRSVRRARTERPSRRAKPQAVLLSLALSSAEGMLRLFFRCDGCGLCCFAAAEDYGLTTGRTTGTLSGEAVPRRAAAGEGRGLGRPREASAGAAARHPRLRP